MSSTHCEGDITIKLTNICVSFEKGRDTDRERHSYGTKCKFCPLRKLRVDLMLSIAAESAVRLERSLIKTHRLII